MRLIEASSKAVLARYGLQSPPGRLCVSGDEATTAAAEIGCPVYVKAQIPFGDRAAFGLVTRAGDAGEAGEQASAMLGRVVEGSVVGSVLVEAAVASELSVYISAHVDDATRERTLRIGIGGGAGYRPDDAQIQTPVPLRGLETFEIRNLIGASGLTGQQREAVTRAAIAVIRAAREWHAYTVEINPLFVTDSGPIAIDAKAELDDYSLGNVPDRSLLPEQADSPRERRARIFQEQDYRGSFRYVQLIDEGEEGDGSGPIVGSHSVGGGESLVVFDALAAVGLRPANYCDTSGAPSQAKVAFAAELIASQPHISGLFFSSCIANQPLSVTAAGLVEGFEAAGWKGPTVVRIAGNQEDQARAIVQEWVARTGVDAAVLGREVDEWEAAQALAQRLGQGAA